MFVQVIQGRAPDPGRLRAALERWESQLGPSAQGWLGTTAGVTEDGRFVALVRFESEELARRNSDRAEQDRWWSETVPLLEDVAFHDGTDVVVDLPGDPGRAGFVQVMQGRTSDPSRGRELMGTHSAEWSAFRPEMLGTVLVQHGADAFTVAAYFTSEQAAREGEQREPPPELAADMEELNALGKEPPTFFDLKQPWLSAPGALSP
jgi:hypothetical protein